MSKYTELKGLFYQLFDLEENIAWHDYNPNSSVIVGCDCGCGGNAIDWEAARNDFLELAENLNEVEAEIREILGEAA